MGKIDQQISKQALRMGKPIPDRILNAPELQLGLELYLDAFFDLDSERTHGFGLTPIPWSSIKGYAEAWEFDEEQTRDLLFLVKKMDQAHLERLEAKQKTKTK